MDNTVKYKTAIFLSLALSLRMTHSTFFPHESVNTGPTVLENSRLCFPYLSVSRLFVTTCLSVIFIRTMSSICVCVSVFLRPYVRISCSQLCVNVSVCHIHVYYTSLSCISTTVCRSTCLCVCLSYFFCICMPVYLHIRHIRTHNVFHMCLCVCVRPYVRISCSQLCVHVSVCHIQVNIHPFRTFLRLSVDLCVFVYVYIHANIYYNNINSCNKQTDKQLFVRLFVTFVRHPLNTCLCV